MRIVAGRNEMNRRGEQVVEEQVALNGRMCIAGGQHQRTLESGGAGRRSGHARVVRLHGAARHQRIGALAQRVCDEELELACLVAAEREAGEIVAFDQDVWTALGSAERRTKTGGFDERRRECRKRKPRLRIERDHSVPHGHARVQY